jgi:hypothetical protein
MASLSDRTLTSSANPLRTLVLGGAVVALVLLGLRFMTAEETSFYRTHGMVPDAHTAVRLAQMVLESGHPGCGAPQAQTAQLQGDVWSVDARAGDGVMTCRVALDRKDGQVLRVVVLP